MNAHVKLLWPLALQTFPLYQVVGQRTDREIPIVVLEPPPARRPVSTVIARMRGSPGPHRRARVDPEPAISRRLRYAERWPRTRTRGALPLGVSTRRAVLQGNDLHKVAETGEVAEVASVEREPVGVGGCRDEHVHDAPPM